MTARRSRLFGHCAWEVKCQILLRFPNRGGVTAVRCTRRRLTLWAAGAYATLLEDLAQDTARASLRDATRQARSATASADSVTRRAIRLISIGEVSRGVNLLTSHGLVDVNTEGVRDQLLAKHPSRCDELSGAALAFTPETRLGVDLSARLRTAKSGIAPGVYGLRNEHLRFLVGDFAPPSAPRTLTGLTQYAEAYVNDELPLGCFARGATEFALRVRVGRRLQVPP